MNEFEARTILELPENWTELDLKKNYRRLAKLYHPDKCKSPESNQFIKIQEAYERLSNPELSNSPDQQPFDDLLNNLFNSFKHMPFKVDIFGFKDIPFKNVKVNVPPVVKEIEITPKEYFTGTTHEFETRGSCNCEEYLCTVCCGCGFKNIHKMETCMECVGNGTYKKCDCKQVFKIFIEPFPNLEFGTFKLKISDQNYKVIDNKLFYIFDITLKESLVGFTKTFKDPFEEIHDICVKNTIIKQNDGYLINFKNYKLTLLFNVIYPKKIKNTTKKILQDLEF